MRDEHYVVMLVVVGRALIRAYLARIRTYLGILTCIPRYVYLDAFPEHACLALDLMNAFNAVRSCQDAPELLPYTCIMEAARGHEPPGRYVRGLGGRR